MCAWLLPVVYCTLDLLFQLVNNAGISSMGAAFSAEGAKAISDCNYKGTTPDPTDRTKLPRFFDVHVQRANYLYCWDSVLLIPSWCCVVLKQTLFSLCLTGTMRITDTLMPFIRRSADGRVIKCVQRLRI
jgi:hypothetical protein